MASAIGIALGVGIAVKLCETAIEMVIQKLAKEVKPAMNFKEEFEELKGQLILIKTCLLKADKRDQQEAIQEWLRNIREIVLLAEDVFEECAVESLHENNLQNCGLVYNRRIFRCRIERQIKYIKKKIESIIKMAKGLAIFLAVIPEPEENSERVGYEKSTLLPSHSHPVGIEPKVNDMLRLLNNSDSPVIAVVGMGGVGKTYLLQHLYHHHDIKARYKKILWLSVSQSFSISKLQNDIIFQLDTEGEPNNDGGLNGLNMNSVVSKASKQSLARMIYKMLQGKSYLVVLDDVWPDKINFDLLVELGLQHGKVRACKIVVSTRSMEICKILKAEIYQMKYLSTSESLELFCVYAFGENKTPPNDLKDLCDKLVEKCGNLPLAITTIAASLAGTTAPKDWESKLEQRNESPSSTELTLRLSYDLMPSHLRACFAYLSFFPHGEEINCEYLINLWIAEGYIATGEHEWDDAWKCLKQLANRCLLQICEDGRHNLNKYCTIHQLLLDLAIEISKVDKCSFSLKGSSIGTDGDWHRILLGKRDLNDQSISNISPVCLRTFSLSQNKRIQSIPANLFKAMSKLRVLDLSGTSITALPESIGKMKLLKVLNLNDTEIEEVPEYVRHLKTLLILALPKKCEKLPVWASELIRLRHLQCMGVCRIPKEISKLDSLRTLRSEYLDLNGDEFMKPGDFVSMTQLQEIWLNVNDETELTGMEQCIFGNLVKMRHLTIKNKTDGQLELPQRMREMRYLESLTIEKFAVPDSICHLASLMDLDLKCCDCDDYPLLHEMLNLVKLNLNGNTSCKKLEMFGNSQGFPRLRFLTIEDFPELEEFPKFEEGAMACLEEFRLLQCSKVIKVGEVGEGLERLRTLKLFSYYKSGTDEFKLAFQEGGGHRNHIKSINPLVTITSNNI